MTILPTILNILLLSTVFLLSTRFSCGIAVAMAPSGVTAAILIHHLPFRKRQLALKRAG
jgi:hypothetical protein